MRGVLLITSLDKGLNPRPSMKDSAVVLRHITPQKNASHWNFFPRFAVEMSHFSRIKARRSQNKYTRERLESRNKCKLEVPFKGLTPISKQFNTEFMKGRGHRRRERHKAIRCSKRI